MMMYDAEVGRFKEILVAGGLHIDPLLHPWVIIRAMDVPERKCAQLTGCIRQLLVDRATVQARFLAEAGFANAGADAEPYLGGDDHDAIETEAEGHNVHMLVLFDEDVDDPDYIYEASNMSLSEEEGEGSDEETDLDEKEVTRDLIVVSDSDSDIGSVCSQEL